MRRRVVIIVGLAVVLALGLTGGAIALGQSDDAPATGAEADRAGAVAVESVGGGRVVEVERDPEGARVWKVEVAQDGGTLTDVELDANYQVIQPAPDGSDADETELEDSAEDATEGPDDAAEPDDDKGDTEHHDGDADDTEDGDLD